MYSHKCLSECLSTFIFNFKLVFGITMNMSHSFISSIAIGSDKHLTREMQSIVANELMTSPYHKGSAIYNNTLSLEPYWLVLLAII